MKHGYVKGETFEGYAMHPGARMTTKKIGLSFSNTYRFVGYKSSVLRHLIDTADHQVSGRKNDLGFTVQCRVSKAMKEAHEQIADTYRGAALAVVGGHSSAIEAIGNVLDGVTVLGYVKGMLPDRDSAPPLKRPGKKSYAWDHMVNGRIIVDLALHKDEKRDWYDFGQREIPLRFVANLVNMFKT